MKYVLVNKLDEIVTKVKLEKTSTISEAITYFQGIKKMPDTIEFNKLWKVMTENDYDMKSRSPFFNGNNIFSSDEMGGEMGGEMPDFFKMFFGGGPVDIGRMSGFAGPGGMNGHPNIHIFRNGKPVFRKTMKPAAISKTITIPLTDAYNGVKYPLEIERWIILNNMKKTENETIYVDIYKGIDSNEIIIVEGKGNINEHGMQGDIKIFIKIDNHKVMDRHGLNLVVNKDITLKDSLVGFKFDVTHLNGKTYTINNTNGKVINPGYKSVIENMGMVRGDQVGKLIVVFHVNFPKNLSEEQRKKLRDIL